MGDLHCAIQTMPVYLFDQPFHPWLMVLEAVHLASPPPLTTTTITHFVRVAIEARPRSGMRKRTAPRTSFDYPTTGSNLKSLEDVAIIGSVDHLRSMGEGLRPEFWRRRQDMDEAARGGYCSSKSESTGVDFTTVIPILPFPLLLSSPSCVFPSSRTGINL